MSILNVNTIQPVGTGQTVTVSATDLKIGTTTLSSGGSGTFVGNVTGNITGNVTGNVNSSGISTMTTLRTGAIQTTSGVDISNKILQVINVIKQDTFVTTSTSYSVVTGLSITITPKLASSSILIIPSINGNAQNRGGTIEIRRNGSRVTALMPTGNGSRGPTNIGGLWTGDASGDNGMMFGRTIHLLDSPATTSATTYAVYARTLDPNSYGTRINYTNDDSDADDYIRGVSTLTVMEIAQ
jgi:hypothetical protein